MAGSTISLREKQKHHTHTEIVRIAFDLFAARGYEDISVEMICDAVGISRATFFNYFPQKELILREIATTRVEKLKAILTRFAESGKKLTFDDIVALFLEVTSENTRIVGSSRRLLLSLWFQQVTNGTMMAARQQAINILTSAIKRIPRQKAAAPRLVAETLFAIYMATTLEWLIREEEPGSWLLTTMRNRLKLGLEGMA
ncbi:MAG: TetR/AcrR family transcriptional regulator [Edaphobacter sp.]